MNSQDPRDAMTIGQLGHHPGLHVMVNLEGMTVGGALFEAEHWVRGMVVGQSALGQYVTIKLDQPIGARERHGLLHHAARGQELVSVDDPACLRPLELAEVHPGGVPQEIVDLAQAGKTLKAIKQYRALNGATMDEARAAIARLQSS